MKAALLIVGYVLCTAPVGAADSSDVIGSEWWIASRRDPGMLRNSIGEVRSFRITGENGKFYNLELPNGQTSTLRKEWLHKAIEDNRLVSSKPAEGAQWWIRKPDMILDITLGKSPGPFTISGEPRGFYYIAGPDGRRLGQISESTFDRYVQEKVLVNYDPAEEIQAEIRQQKVDAQKKESNAKLAAVAGFFFAGILSMLRFRASMMSTTLPPRCGAGAAMVTSLPLLWLSMIRSLKGVSPRERTRIFIFSKTAQLRMPQMAVRRSTR